MFLLLFVVFDIHSRWRRVRRMVRRHNRVHPPSEIPHSRRHGTEGCPELFPLRQQLG